jgi:S1-C subfamily serine protease
MSDETPEPESTQPGPIEPAEPAQLPGPTAAGLNYPVAPEPMATPAGWWVPQPAPSVAPRAANSVWHRLAAAVVVAAVVAAAAGAGIGWSLERRIAPPASTAQTITQPQTQPQSQQTRPESPIQPVSPGTGSTLNVDAIAAKVNPAIVDINTTLTSGQAAGTGTIISSTGEILTNNHVIDGSTNIQVTVSGRADTYTAHLVASDGAADIAVIQIDGTVSGLPTVSFASSSSLNVGDPVVALGNALGRGGSPVVSQGSVTALDQTITASEGGGKSEQLSGMIQTDATIYPGDSGGPLVNSAGQVVGMITAGEAQGFRSSSSSINYSIPSDTILAVVNQIRAGQTSADITYGQSGYIGVSVETLDAQNAAALGLNVSSGALVRSVQPGTAADRAGITPNSVITAVGGSRIASLDDLDAAVRAHKSGDRVSITWVNQSGSHTATVTLGGINR